MVAKETTLSVAPMLFIFAYMHTIIQTKATIDRKRPVPEFISDELKGFLVFFCPPLNDIFVGIF